MSFQDEEKTAMTPPPSPDLGDRTVAVGERTQVAEPQTCPVCETVSPGTEQYCLDCGFLLSETPGEAPAAVAPPAVLVDHNGREFPLRIGENSIGRESADVLLNDSAVSRKHASITVGESAIEIEDLGSTNGTYVNGEKLEPNAPRDISTDDEIVLGQTVLRLKLPEEPVPVAGEGEQSGDGGD